MSSDSKTFIRMVACKKCKVCTPTELLQIGSQKDYLIISGTCENCDNSANIFLTQIEWDNLKDGQVRLDLN